MAGELSNLQSFTHAAVARVPSKVRNYTVGLPPDHLRSEISF